MRRGGLTDQAGLAEVLAASLARCCPTPLLVLQSPKSPFFFQV